MTPQELAQKVKAKYPAYKDIPDDELVRRVIEKYPVYASQIKEEGLFSKITKGITSFIGESTGLSGLVDTVKGKSEPIIKKGGLLNPQTGKLQQPFNVGGVKSAAGTGAKLGLTAATLGGGLGLGGATRTIAEGAGLGGAYGAAQGLEEKKSITDIGKSALIGTLVGGATAGLFEAGKWSVRKIPKLLSYFSDTPEAVLQRNFDNPEAMKEASNYVSQRGPSGVLQDVQAPVRQLRNTLSQQYQEGKNAVIELNKGRRTIFNSKTQSLLNKVADTFGITLPQNMDNVSVNEAIALNEEINSALRHGSASVSPEGAVLRKAKDALDSILKGPKSNFSGVWELLSNYAGEKKTLDAADMIVQAYHTGNPIKQRTALSRLLAVYNENAPSFLSAMKDLETKTGVPILDKLAALKSSSTSPATSVMKSDTVLSVLRSAFRVFADDLSRGAGRVSKFAQRATPSIPFVSGQGGFVATKERK